MRFSCGLVFLGLLCCNEAEPPQSQPTAATVKTEGEKPAERILIPMQATPSPVSNPVALEALQAHWPELDRLPPMRARVVGAAMNLAPGPCGSCGEDSFALCALSLPEDCPVLGPLIARAVMQATNPAATVREVEANLNYPDQWFDLSSAGGVLLGNKDAPIRVDLFLDATGRFAFETSGSLAKIRTSHPGDVRVYLHPADTPAGHAIWALAGEEQLEAFVAGLFAASVPGKSKPWNSDELAKLAASVTTQVALPEQDPADTRKAQDRDLGQSLGVIARPTWFVAGHRLPGAQSGMALIKMIQRERLPSAP